MLWENKRDKIMKLIYEDIDIHRELFCESLRDYFHARLEDGVYDKKFNEAFDLLIKAPRGSTLTITIDFKLTDENRTFDFFKVIIDKVEERKRNAIQGV